VTASDGEVVEQPFAGEPGRVLRWRTVVPRGTSRAPAVLVVHGYTSHGDWGFYPLLSERLAARGIATVRVSLSGSALGPDRRSLAAPEVFATNTYVKELDELALVRDRMQADPRLCPERRAILGHSRGGAMAVVHAAEDGGYRAVVGWAAMDSILRFSPERLAEWREQGHVMVRHYAAGVHARLDVSVLHAAEAARERLDVLRACARLRCPALFVVGSQDRSVPVTDGERMAAASEAAELLTVEGDHVFDARDPLDHVPAALAQVVDGTEAFLVRTLAP